MCIGELSNSN
jgi:hypothetical protein